MRTLLGYCQAKIENPVITQWQATALFVNSFFTFSEMSFRMQPLDYSQWKVKVSFVSLQNDQLKQGKATIYHTDHIHPLVCIPASKTQRMGQAATSTEKYKPTDTNMDILYSYMYTSCQLYS